MAGIVHRQKQGDQLLILPSENIFFFKSSMYYHPILDERKDIIIQYYGSMFSLWNETSLYVLMKISRINKVFKKGKIQDSM